MPVEDAGSNLVSGRGTNALTFTLPGSPRYAVQSVVATVDNTAGGDTGATLTMRDRNGAVIATNAQESTIPAGGTGTATFALRLDNSSGSIRYNRVNTGGWLYVTTTGTGGPNAASIQFVAQEDIRLDFTRDIDIEGTPGRDINFSTDNDFNAFVTRDYNVTANRDVNIGAARNSSLDGPNRVNVTSADLIDISSSGGDVDVFATSGRVNVSAETVSTLAASGGWNVTSLSGGLINVRGAALDISLFPGGTKVTVHDQADAAIFEVRADGSLHGKTGQALTFDL